MWESREIALVEYPDARPGKEIEFRARPGEGLLALLGKNILLAVVSLRAMILPKTGEGISAFGGRPSKQGRSRSNASYAQGDPW